MSNPRSVVSFGIGFGALAIASIGLLPIAVEQDQSGGALNVAQQRQIIAKESERLAKQRKLAQEQAEALERLARTEAERREAEAERQYADLVARLSVVETEELPAPVELSPDAIDKLEAISKRSIIAETYTDRTAHVQKTAESIQVADDDEAMALIMILAEID